MKQFTTEEIEFVMEKRELSREDAEALLVETAQAFAFHGKPMPPVFEHFAEPLMDPVSAKEFFR